MAVRAGEGDVRGSERTFCPAYASGKWYVMACEHGTRQVSAWLVCGLEGRAYVVLRVVLKLLGRDGGAKEVLEVLEHVLRVANVAT